MITPGDDIPLDDQDFDEAGDQQSQKDIHSNGFDDDNFDNDDEFSDDYNGTDADRLQQASDASEAAYTLDLDDDDDE